jgi:dTDP-4-dehydrorhamnose 3,5-epimerase
VLIVEPQVFPDNRGWLVESFNKRRYAQHGIDVDFVQDNHSSSVKGVLRGLHYQVGTPQAKLVSCVRGRVWDVVVDVRRGSPAFGQWEHFILDAEKKAQVFVPTGFAHGFAALTDDAEVQYKCSTFYDPKGQAGIIWNDPELAIEWPFENPILSEKDAALPRLADAELFTY